MKPPSPIRIGQSCAPEAEAAVRAFHAAVQQPDMALVIFFCSNEYDPDAFAREMRRLFAGVQVVGCSTAGEIGPAGYGTHCLVGASFAHGSFEAVVGHLDDLQHFDADAGQALARSLMRRLESRAPQADAGNSFAFMLIDGLSLREEPVTRAFQHTLGRLALVGGSSGDGLNFHRSRVYVDGECRSDSVALVLVTTRLPFELFLTQNLVASDQRMVVTEADPALRLVKEINGLPAAHEYARVLGLDADKLDARSFAASPIVVTINGTNYVRSIQKANPDGSLTFYCAIEEGLVLRTARSVDLPGNLRQAFARVRADVGPPQIVLGCDCVLRRLEVFEDGLEGPVGEVLAENNVVGFSTYGEQFRGMHLNRTFVGIAIGEGAKDAAGA